MISLQQYEELVEDGLNADEVLKLIRRRSMIHGFDYGDRVKPEIVVTDGIMASKKSTNLIKSLKKGVTNGQALKECYLIIVPYLGEVTRYLEDLKELNFAQPEVTDGCNKRDDFLRLIQDGRNIVTTHAMFHLWGEQIRDEIAHKEYNIIIDEEITCIEPLEMTLKAYKELCATEYISVDANGRITWDTSKSGGVDEYDGMFKKIMQHCISGSVFLCNNSKTSNTKVFMIWNLPTDFFQVGKTMRIMTFRFKSSIIRAYCDLHKLEYRVEYTNKEAQRAMHKRATDFIDLIDLPKSIQGFILGKTALCHSWPRNQKVEDLKTIRTKIANWLRKTLKVTNDDLIYTCSKELSDPSNKKNLALPRFRNKEVDAEHKAKGITNLGPWLPFNTNGTNLFKDKKVVLYMHNVYPNVTLTKFFEENKVYFNKDEYALSCLLQFIWRSCIRRGEEEVDAEGNVYQVPVEDRSIKLILPSLRMKKLFIEWRDTQLEFDNAATKYRLTNPSGDLVEFMNLSDFCMLNDIDKGNLSKVLKGERTQHKGWKLPLSSDECF